MSGRLGGPCAALLAGALLLAPAAAGAQTPATSTTSAAPADSVPAYMRAPVEVLPRVPLWPGTPPGALGADSTDLPSVTPYLPPAARRTGTAVLVFPGGSYQHLSLDREGDQVARWLASTGVTAFLVRYRLGPRYRHPVMRQDAQRALRLVRARAADFGVDPQRIGVLGFSAGGHLASTVGTHFADTAGADARPVGDAVDGASARPDFQVLVYPVITMDERWAHAGSRRNLIGERPSAELARAMSNETRVTGDTPPTFLVASTDDTTVPVENSLLLYQALRSAQVPVELHVFERGRHGFALAPADPVLARWLTLCEAWMRRHGWLDRAPGADAAR